MKLAIPMIIIVLGMCVGILVCKLFKENFLGFKLSVLAGGVGAFAGMLIRDVMDVSLGGDLQGTLIAAVLGAAFFSAVTNFLFGRIGEDR